MQKRSLVAIINNRVCCAGNKQDTNMQENTMLEAVNSVLSNATLIKAAVSAQRSETKRTDLIKVTSANYVSRHVELDAASRRAILQIRDTSTGESLKQFPTEGQIRAYLNAQQAGQASKAQESGKAPPSAVEQKAIESSTPDVIKPDTAVKAEPLPLQPTSPTVSQKA